MARRTIRVGLVVDPLPGWRGRKRPGFFGPWFGMFGLITMLLAIAVYFFALFDSSPVPNSKTGQIYGVYFRGYGHDLYVQRWLEITIYSIAIPAMAFLIIAFIANAYGRSKEPEQTP